MGASIIRDYGGKTGKRNAAFSILKQVKAGCFFTNKRPKRISDLGSNVSFILIGKYTAGTLPAES